MTKAKLLSLAAAAALAFSSAGCACCRAESKRAEGRTPAPEVISPRATVGHWVFFWLKEPGDADGRRRIVEASQTLRDIPGVVSVHVGTALPSDRPVIDSTYDVAVLVLFTDETALRAYVHAPTHQNAAAAVGPIIAKTQVYDFTIE